MAVNFEITIKSDEGRASIFESELLPTADNLDELALSVRSATEAARRLHANGIDVLDIGRFSISARCEEDRFSSFFGTELRTVQLRPVEGADEPETPAGRAAAYEARVPAARVTPPETDGLNDLLERVYVQPDPILFAGERPVPPAGLMRPKFRLRVPGDIAQLMGATVAHRSGTTGRGVRVAMVDGGFYHHPYFVDQGYDFLAVPAPDVADPQDDPSGHGTGEAANLFATAPGINFIGVKMGNPTLAFRTAAQLRPDVITCSWGFHVDFPGTTMPNWLKPLYLEVLNAIANGTIVCFSAGNGHRAFPANVPQVIAVGGTVVQADLDVRATEYTSSFDSAWFAGRHLPDITGLCGEPPTADYIVLPVPAGSALEISGGWGAFSGTSAASPMVAGVCALLREVDADITPADAKRVLQYTAFDVKNGKSAHGDVAAPGKDAATGYGLVDAGRAVNALV